jgi:hypothetical protein
VVSSRRDEVNCGNYERQGRATRPVAEGKELQAIIDQLYRLGDKIPGGTAGAVRTEGTHLIKAAERARQLQKAIALGKFTGKDLTLAKALVIDLANALMGK